MRRIILGLVAVALAGCGVTAVATEPGPNTVSYWCSAGIKLEPVATPFVVPAPPAGWTWTLLVLKAGSGPGENETFVNPVVGQAYSRTDGKSISHVILCKQPPATTTTSTSTTSTSTTSTTSTLPETTSTTVPITFPPSNTFGVPGGSTTTTEPAPGSTTTAPPPPPPPVTSSTTLPPLQTTTTVRPPTVTTPPPRGGLPATE